MNEFKGTQGKWLMNGLSESGNNHFKIIGSIVGGRYKIARVPFEKMGDDYEKYNKREQDEAEANAKLISAAPELLAFAVDFVEKVESGRAKSTDSYNKAKKAISKALGLRATRKKK